MLIWDLGITINLSIHTKNITTRFGFYFVAMVKNKKALTLTLITSTIENKENEIYERFSQLLDIT